jgi:hypothetical protein
VSARRDLAAARRFFTRAMRAGTFPAEVITDSVCCAKNPHEAILVRMAACQSSPGVTRRPLA